MALSTIGTVVVPVTASEVVVVVDVEVVDEVEPVVGVAFVVPILRKLATMALSSFQTGNRMSAPL